MPLENRVKLFLNVTSKLPGNTIQSLNNLLKLKHIFFTEKECSDIDDFNCAKFDDCNLETFVQLLFVKDSKTNKPKALLFYNPKGYFNDEGFENFDSLKVFDISLNGKGVKQLRFEEVKKAFESQQLVSQKNLKIEPQMIKKGRLHIEPLYKNDCIDTEHKIGERRIYKKTGEKGPITYFDKKGY